MKFFFFFVKKFKKFLKNFQMENFISFNYYPTKIFKNQYINTSNSILISPRIYIYCCFFNNIYSSTSGGAFSISTSTIFFKILNSNFNSCSSNSYGGACYFECPYLNIEFCLFFNCSNKMSITFGSCFYSSKNHLSFLQYNSFKDHQLIEFPDFHCSFIIRYGEVFSEYCNSSYCSHTLTSGLYHYDSIISKIIFYNSANHYSGGAIGLGGLNNIGQHEYINFINNTVSKGIIIISNSIITLYKTIFYNNNGNILDNYNNPGYLTLINCYFSNSMSQIVNVLTTINCSTNLNYTPYTFKINLSFNCFSNFSIPFYLFQNFSIAKIFLIFLY